ncbi:MAG: hypothetical protein IKW58_01235 [Alphaproteobacteria bacterium]|nr:hypothetical protein [Alphaproteobacteria bacterium]
MKKNCNLFNKVGNDIGYPFFVFADGKCLKHPISDDGRDVYVLEVNGPFENVEDFCFDNTATDDVFDIWDIKGKSIKELLSLKNDASPLKSIFLPQNEKKEFFEYGNGEALKFILNKFQLSDVFSEILFKRGLENLVKYYLEKQGYSQNLENSITKYGSAELISMIITEARFSKDALITLIERGFDGIILLYLRKKEESCFAYGNLGYVALEKDVESAFILNAKTNNLKTYIKRYGLRDHSIEALLKRDEVELMIDYLRKINDDFSDFAITKLDTLNSIELKELYKKTFG